MGCGASSVPAPDAGSAAIGSGPEPSSDTTSTPTVDLLLLGPGDSGKSTFLRQIKIIHMSGFTVSEREQFRKTIHDNILEGIQILIMFAQQCEYPLEAHVKQAVKSILSMPLGTELTPELANDIKTLWSEPSIQSAHLRRSESQLEVDLSHYMPRLDQIRLPEYLPDNDDILHARVRTTGMSQVQFKYGHLNFRLLDVGGQRNERRKWIHCFEGVNAVIFVVAISEYDQRLFEDERVNRMHESLWLFENIWNSPWFLDTSFVLFLNKCDIFAQKIKSVDLNVCFPEYTGGCDHDAAIQYMQRQFQSVNQTTDRMLYLHVTCNTDTKATKKIFDAVKDIIFRENLFAVGIL